MVEVTEVDLAWIAGLFDGEGCVLIQRGRATSQNGSVEVRISMTAREALEEVQRFFGGNIRDGRARTERWKQTYIWALYGEAAVDFLVSLYTYFRNRHSRKRTEVIVQYQKIKARGGKGKTPTEEDSRAMGALREDLHIINKRGIG